MTHKTLSARPLTFRDLEEIVARLRNDPHVHPSTPIEIVIEVETVEDAGFAVTKRLVHGLGAVCLGGGTIMLAESGSMAGGVAFAQ